MSKRRAVIVIRLAVLTAASSHLSAATPPAAVDETNASQSPAEAISDSALPNAFRLSSQVLSGGRPDDDRGFAALKALGVRTIISVDGARPDVERAARYGLRYVHLPHGYDGVPTERRLELTKAVRDLPGPVYIHCHHGRHRSPAAAAIACVGLGTIEPSQARRFLEQAGTNPRYEGLFRSVAETMPIDAARLDQLNIEFRQRVPLPPIAEAMVAIETSHDRLHQLAARRWEVTATSEPMNAAHEAILLEECLTELLRDPEVLRRPQPFRQLLQESQGAAVRLRQALEADSNVEVRQQAWEAIDRNCRTCHEQFRDVPR